MKFQKYEGGFILSLDATLALLITLIALVGIAQIGNPSTIYKQHGYLQLERYANDGLRVLRLNDSLRKAIRLVNEGDNDGAKRIIRDNLNKILPKEVKFKVMVGGRGEEIWLDNIYPTKGANQEWKASLENAEEVATSGYVTVETVKLVENLDILVWADDPVERDFVQEEMEGYLGWEIKTTDNQDQFQNYLDNQLFGWRTDVVFVPDANPTPSWSEETVEDLFEFNFWAYGDVDEDFGGGVVGGGRTVYYDEHWKYSDLISEILGGSYMESIFGLEDTRDFVGFWPFWGHWERDLEKNETSGTLKITDADKNTTRPFDENEEISTPENTKYTYEIESGVWELGTWFVGDNEWPAIIEKPHGIELFGITIIERSVLFNAQAIRNWDELGRTTPEAKKWASLIKRAIEWSSRESPTPALVTLQVWRGENVGQ